MEMVNGDGTTHATCEIWGTFSLDWGHFRLSESSFINFCDPISSGNVFLQQQPAVACFASSVTD